jgi:hypothetical protein
MLGRRGDWVERRSGEFEGKAIEEEGRRYSDGGFRRRVRDVRRRGARERREKGTRGPDQLKVHQRKTHRPKKRRKEKDSLSFPSALSTSIRQPLLEQGLRNARQTRRSRSKDLVLLHRRQTRPRAACSRPCLVVSYRRYHVRCSPCSLGPVDVVRVGGWEWTEGRR